MKFIPGQSATYDTCDRFLYVQEKTPVSVVLSPNYRSFWDRNQYQDFDGKLGNSSFWNAQYKFGQKCCSLPKYPFQEKFAESWITQLLIARLCRNLICWCIIGRVTDAENDWRDVGPLQVAMRHNCHLVITFFYRFGCLRTIKVLHFTM